MDVISQLRNNMNRTVSYKHSETEEEKFIDEVKLWRDRLKISYIKSLIYPEEHKGAKVPSTMPTDTATASIHYPFTITPNASGKFLLVLDPVSESGYLYQDSTLNGTGSGVLTPMTFTQDSTIIDEWRLVSSSIILRYYGSFNSLSGFFVAACTPNKTLATQTTFLNFSAIEDLQNKELFRAGDGVKLIFNPKDSLVTEFTSQTTYSGNSHPSRWSYLFVIYGDNFPNQACIRADYQRNIEYTSKTSYREYIPHSKNIPCEPISLSIDKAIVRPAPTKNEKIAFDELTKKGAEYILNNLSESFPTIGKDAMNPFFSPPNLFNKSLYTI